MDDLFAPPGGEWQRVSPALVTERRVLLSVVAGLLLLAGAGVLGAFLPLWAAGVWVVLVAGVWAWGWWIAGRNARSWAYAEREEELYITHGVMFRRLTVVPYGRMQYVDVEAGPLDRAYKIATLHLHTASPGTSAVIPGLPEHEADRLRDRLTALGESQAAGL